MLTISQISTNVYTNNNCRKPCFKAGMSYEALVASMDILSNDLKKQQVKNIASGKKMKLFPIQWFLNIFKSHKTNNISESSKIDSPIGKLELSPEGVKQYAEVATCYAKGYTWRNKLYSAETKVIKSKLMMEVLSSLGEFSTNYNDVIKSKTFGEIKVTEEGLKQYLDTIKLYAEGFPARNKCYNDKQRVIESEQMINIIKGNGELPENDA